MLYPPELRARKGVCGILLKALLIYLRRGFRDGRGALSGTTVGNLVLASLPAYIVGPVGIGPNIIP